MQTNQKCISKMNDMGNAEEENCEDIFLGAEVENCDDIFFLISFYMEGAEEENCDDFFWFFFTWKMQRLTSYFFTWKIKRMKIVLT